MERGSSTISANSIETIELSKISFKDSPANGHDPVGSLETQSMPRNRLDEETQKDGGFWAWATVISAYA